LNHRRLSRAAVAVIFEKDVFGFMTSDIQREIQLARRTVAGAFEPDVVQGGGNVLAAMGLLTFTEFLGWIMKRMNVDNRGWDEERMFNEGFRLMGPCYRDLLDQKLVKPYHEFRSSLVHNFAVEKNFSVDMPGDDVCGIVLKPDGWHIVVERYFDDFCAAADALYEASTGNSASEARARSAPTAKKPDSRLASVLEKLGDLVVEVPALRDLLDFAIGAAASFMRAEQLGYKDRPFELPANYYERVGARAKWMAKGRLPPYGLWISGYFFNSGILRLWSAHDQLERLEDDIAGRRAGPSRAPAKLRLEANRLKHQLSGLGEKRELTFDEAVGFLVELVAIVDQQRSLLTDPAVAIPKMRVKGRTRRRRSR
jgi:hypothetical protein